AVGVRALDDLNFDVLGGEVLGIAGISGCGQRELLESIAGLYKTTEGSSVKYYPPEGGEVELIGLSAKKIRDAGVALSFVPEDRLGMGLVGSMGMVENVMLKSYDEGKNPLIDKHGASATAEEIYSSLQVVTPSLDTPVRRLSGGNIQKVLVGREISNAPSVLMTAYAVRGLDINTSYMIYDLINQQKEKGVAVIFVGEDLDVLLAISDRILVLCGGKSNGIVDARKSTKEEVGLLMTKLKNTEKEEESHE
ncbi:MAG: ATP-binding cassette domain-containing protein, partial [Clostridia bacterium]|nr:ATP-binding cassette domain-containing protein [Clostridia bacterium]